MEKISFPILTNLFRTIDKLNQDKMVKVALSDKALQDEVIRMNTMDQLYEEGIDSEGRELGQYSGATIEGTANFEGKKQKGQRYDHITLNDTGKFYKSFKFKNNDEDFVITANTKKKDKDLATDFGPNILGLTNANIGYIIPEVKNSLLEQLREKFLA